MITAFVIALAATAPASCRDLEVRDPRAAMTCYESELASRTDPRGRADALTDLAWFHWKLSQFERSLAAFHQVVAISREIHDRTLEGRTINFIGLLYQTIGDPATALDHYKQASAIARETGDVKLQAEVLYHLGWIHFVMRDFQTSLKYYRESLAARRDARTLFGLGMAHTSLGEFDEALRVEEEALLLARANADRDAEADALDHIGTALTFLKRPAEAIEKHLAALQIRRERQQISNLAFSLVGLARAHHATGDVKAAAALMGEVIDGIEGGRRNIVTRRFRASMFARVRGHYERFIAYLVELGDIAGAFSITERSRARLTLDAVQDALARADAKAHGTLVQREQTLQNQIENAGANLESLLEQLARVEADIRAAYPRLAAARESTPLTASAIQSQLLDDDTALVEYALSDEKSFAWVLTRSEIRGVELPKREEIEKIAVRLHAALATGDQRVNQHAIETAIDRLSAIIIAPLKLPRGVSRLIVVPDGALFYIPFAALEDDSRTLIDHYEITVAPSASSVAVMTQAARGRTHEAALAIFADPVFRPDDARVRNRGAGAAEVRDPDLVRSAKDAGIADLRRLPSTRIEADAISRLTAGPTRKALDFAASRKSVLTENLGRYRVVHFATHALINAQRPQLSGIVLSLVDENGAPVDGFVRVHDLFMLEVPTDLVVLSACRTAMGKELRGEGIVGLVSAFLAAGAPRVVASYWDVKDRATAELMKRFYRRMLRDRLPPAAALRAAQRSMRKEDRYKSPYYWAAFALHGAR